MDKIKLMYDVVKTMRGKDVFKGALKAEGTKDQTRVFGFENDFERDNVTGETKAKTSTQMDCQGKKMKMENSIDFEMQGCHGPHGFFGHMHPHPHMMQFREGHFGGIKQHLNGILFVLGVLNSVKVEEQKDKTTVLSLKLADIPDDVRKAVDEHIKHMGEHHESMQGDPDHHAFMKEFHTMQIADFSFKILINDQSEIEKITLEANGKQKDESNGDHDMNFNAELCLEW